MKFGELKEGTHFFGFNSKHSYTKMTLSYANAVDDNKHISLSYNFDPLMELVQIGGYRGNEIWMATKHPIGNMSPAILENVPDFAEIGRAHV